MSGAPGLSIADDDLHAPAVIVPRCHNGFGDFYLPCYSDITCCAQTPRETADENVSAAPLVAFFCRPVFQTTEEKETGVVGPICSLASSAFLYDFEGHENAQRSPDDVEVSASVQPVGIRTIQIHFLTRHSL